MNIFESLENLNVSEECFEDIVRLIEAKIDDDIKSENSKRRHYQKQSKRLGGHLKKLENAENKQFEKGNHWAVHALQQALNKKQDQKDIADTELESTQSTLKDLRERKKYGDDVDPADYDDGDYGMQFVPIQKQHSKDDYEAHVAKHGVT